MPSRLGGLADYGLALGRDITLEFAALQVDLPEDIVEAALERGEHLLDHAG